MHMLTDSHMDWLYPRLLKHVMKHGEEAAPRSQKTREVRPFIFQLTNPVNRLVTLPERKVNYAFALVESFQFVCGYTDGVQLTRYNSNIKNWLDPKTGNTEASYGELTRDQVLYVANILERDPDSRQAVMSIYNGHEHQKPMLNVPCTCTLQFFVRNGQLELTVYMRSNDLWWGVPYDVFQFTAMQEMIASHLDLPLGTYTHIAGSGHIYEPFFEKATAIADQYDRQPVYPQEPLFFENTDLHSTRVDAEAVLTEERAYPEVIGYLPVKFQEHLATLVDYRKRKESRERR